jgi:hypothetical protein
VCVRVRVRVRVRGLCLVFVMIATRLCIYGCVHAQRHCRLLVYLSHFSLIISQLSKLFDLSY